MIEEIRFSKILDGYRGEPPVNKNRVIDVLLSVNKLMIKEKVKELDINPLMVSSGE